MNHGRYQLGQEVTFTFLCRDANGAPADPDSAPEIDVWSETGSPVLGQLVPVLDKQATTGLFQGTVYLDEDFAPGQYYIRTRYQIGAHAGGDLLPFRVLPGGGATGQIIAVTGYERPHGLFLVQQRTSGRVFKGRNPRV